MLNITTPDIVNNITIIKYLDLNVKMLTGDSNITAINIAKSVGIHEKDVISQVLIINFHFIFEKFIFIIALHSMYTMRNSF